MSPKEKMSFRKANEKETMLINFTMAEFGKDIPSKILENEKILISQNRGKKVFLVSKEVYQQFLHVKKNEIPYFIGVNIGKIEKNKRFKLSVEGIHEVGKHTKKKVIVSDKGEQFVLYGHSILKKSVLRIPKNLKKGSNVIIVNVYGDPIGLGRLHVNSEKIHQLKDEDLIVINVLDMGWYLRKGG